MLKRFSLGVLAALLLTLLVGVASVSAAPDESTVCRIVHVVQRGETLYSIAREYGVSMWNIARANGITNPSKIYAGQRLVIPTGQSPGTEPAGTVHIVQRGETLYSIACRYGVSVWNIARANGIANPNRIYVGQRLVIPSR